MYLKISQMNLAACNLSSSSPDLLNVYFFGTENTEQKFVEVTLLSQVHEAFDGGDQHCHCDLSVL